MAERAQRDPDVPQGPHLIAPGEWSYQRWGWLESVRRAVDLPVTARLIAHVLALDFTNAQTLRCDPSLRQIAAVAGASNDTVKRAIHALIEGGWIERQIGDGRGHTSGYVFVSRARILPMKRVPGDQERGANLHPKRAAGVPPFEGSERGAKLPGKGGKSASRHNIAKPWKNHEGAQAREADEKSSSATPRELAEFWAAKIAENKHIPASALSTRVIGILIGEQLISEEQARRLGLGPEFARWRASNEQ